MSKQLKIINNLIESEEIELTHLEKNQCTIVIFWNKTEYGNKAIWRKESGLSLCVPTIMVMTDTFYKKEFENPKLSNDHIIVEDDFITLKTIQKCIIEFGHLAH